MSSQFLCSPDLRAVRSGFFARTIPAGTLLSALLFLLAAAPLAAAPIALVLDTPSTQNFNTLPQSGSLAWVNDSTIPGWYSVRTGTGTTIVADTGGSNGGNLYSYGSAAAITDRALGTLGSSNAAAGKDLPFGSPRPYRSGGNEPLVNGPTRPNIGSETSTLPPRNGQEFSNGRRDQSEGSTYTSLYGR
jgi:hypothetical protein